MFGDRVFPADDVAIGGGRVPKVWIVVLACMNDTLIQHLQSSETVPSKDTEQLDIEMVSWQVRSIAKNSHSTLDPGCCSSVCKILGTFPSKWGRLFLLGRRVRERGNATLLVVSLENELRDTIKGRPPFLIFYLGVTGHLAQWLYPHNQLKQT